jgi:hypothetical protein
MIQVPGKELGRSARRVQRDDQPVSDGDHFCWDVPGNDSDETRRPKGK